MKTHVLFWGVVVLGGVIGPTAVYGQNESKQEIREAFGFRYDLPADYPIRKVNGVVQPAPLSEYVFLKVKEKNEKLDQLEKRIEELAKEIDEIKDQYDVINSRLINSEAVDAEGGKP